MKPVFSYATNMSAMLNHKSNLLSEIDKHYLVIYFIIKQNKQILDITAMTNDLAYMER